MKRVFAFIGFTAAITLILLNIINYSSVKYVFIFAVALLVVSLLVKNIRHAKVIPVVAASMVFACLVFVLNYSLSVAPVLNLGGQTANVTFEIIDIPVSNDDGTFSYLVNVTSVDIPDAPQNFKLRLTTENPINAKAYQNVNAFLYLGNLSGNAFDTHGVYGEGIYLYAKLLNYHTTNDHNLCPALYFIKLRKLITQVLFNNLNDDVFPLALSVFTGNKSYLDLSTVCNFKICGISHIIAVSGLHNSIICLGVYFFLKFLKVPKIYNSIITIVILIIYSGIANFSRSVIRSAIMITIMILAQLIDKKSDSLNSLGAAVFFLCFNPYCVCDISTLLTVTAVLGIVVIKRQIDREYYPENKIIAYFYNAFTVSLSVIITTFPVMWIFFGSVSILSVILNIIIIPFLQIALVSIILLCIFSNVAFLAFLPKAVATFSLKAILSISEFCSEKFSVFFFDVSSIAFGVATVGLVLIIAVYVFAYGKIKAKITLPLTLCVMLVSLLVSFHQSENTVCLYIHSNGPVFAYDKDTFIAVGVDDRGDKFVYDSMLSKRCYETINCIDCDYIDNDNIYGTLCENISVENKDNNIVITLADKDFSISEDYVTIDNKSYVRSINSKYSIDSDVILVYSSQEE